MSSTSKSAWLLLAGMVLVGLNLRPALSSIAPVLNAVREGAGLSAAGAGLLTTLPVLCLGLFAPLAPKLARRIGAEQTILAVLRELEAEGRTVICVHHDLQTVAATFDHVLMLNRTLVAAGPVATTLTDANLRLAYGQRASGLSLLT